jgi:VWFA-related protein
MKRLACVVPVLVFPVAASTAPVPQAAQAPPQVPVFGTEVELITVDAVVLNTLGKAVPGLGREDFQVTEDGRPVEIVSFEAVVEPDAEPLPASSLLPSEPASNTPRSAPGTGRAFAIVIDDLGMAPERSADARAAVRAFLERGVRAGDDVVLGTASGDAWWSARLPEGRDDLLAVAERVRGKYEELFSINNMTEYEAFQIANREDSPALAQSSPGARGDSSGRATGGSGAEALPSGVGGVRERVRKRWEAQMLCTGPACEPMLRGRAVQMDAARRGRTHATLAAIARGIEALRPIHGRKSLLLLSQGFLNDPGDRRTRNVVALSREANTAVYFIDVRGLQSFPGSTGSAAEAPPGPGANFDSFVADRSTGAFEESVLSATGSEGLASDTGGFSVRNTNDLGGGAERIAAESRVFYLLGFYALDGKPAQAWRRLKVTTKRPGLEVRARKGYTLAKAAVTPPAKKAKERAPDPAVLRAVDSPRDATALPMRARVYVLEPGAKQTRVLVAAEFDSSALGPGSEGPRRLEMSAVVRMRDEPQEFRYDQAVELKPAAVGTTWRAIAREFGVPPGAAAVRVVLRDPATGALGSVSSRFEVPGLDVLRVSTPILTDRVEPARAAGESPRPALAVSRAFPRDAGLYCQFEVIGARKGPDGKPRVAAGVSVFAANGSLVRESPSSPVAVDAEGRSVRLVGIDLAGLPEGSYDLVLDVRDEVSDARLRQREPFTIQGQ